MILLLANLVWADACCTTVGAQSSLLPSCDALAVNLGLGGSLESGGWTWDGRWGPSGDDGVGEALLSASLLGRFRPWLQGGMRLPVNLLVDQLDGHSTSQFGLGSGLVWLAFETPQAWFSGGAPHWALELGLGRERQGSTNLNMAQLALRGMGTIGAWNYWGTLTGRLPFSRAGVVDGDASLGMDHPLGSRFLLGGDLGVLASAGTVPSYAVSLGPSLRWTPTSTDQLRLTVDVDLPVPHLGQNTSSNLQASLTWYRALRRVPG